MYAKCVNWTIFCTRPRYLNIINTSHRNLRNCSTAAYTTPQDANGSDKKRKRIIVFGGNGFVGSEVVRSALGMGADVVSISRSGAPAFPFDHQPSDQAGSVSWEKGDIFHAEGTGGWRGLLAEADGVVSCVGAFGSNEFMEKVNGDANINAIGEAMSAGVPRFVYVSTAENNLPSFVLRGYFNGKRRAEQALLDAYPAPGAGVVLRPGFIYGTRHVPFALPGSGSSTMGLPLGLLGKPMEVLFSLAPVRSLRGAVPGMQALLAPPVPVQTVGRVAAAAALGNEQVLRAVAEKQRSSSGSGSDNAGEDQRSLTAANVLSIADINAIDQRL